MRVLTWNMAYWKPGNFKAVANRRRQWALLGALLPDVALLQECRPDDLRDNAPAWMAEEYAIVGSIPQRWTACSAILARRPHSVESLDPAVLDEDAGRWLTYLSGYVAAGTVVVAGRPLRVASVHAVAREIDDPLVTEEDHARVRRPVLGRVWHNDLAAAALDNWVFGHDFVVGGDWNNALLFDVNYPEGAEGGPGGSSQFFERRAEREWRDVLRKAHPDEVRTYHDPASAPYELDRIFTNEVLFDAATQVGVIDDASVVGLSDHSPVWAEFETGDA